MPFQPETLGNGPSIAYDFADGFVRQSITFNGKSACSEIALTDSGLGNPSDAWWKSYIQGKEIQSLNDVGSRLNVIDLFSGSGGLSQGIKLAALSLGFDVKSRIAVDIDGDALAVHRANHGTEEIIVDSVKNLVSYSVITEEGNFGFGIRPRLKGISADWLDSGPTIVVGGPPCQGHSSFNNHTRHNDVRNELYLTVPAFAIALNADVVIIENVTRVGVSRENVVGASIQLLESAGYGITTGVLTASSMGWPQTRRRFFIVAIKGNAPVELMTIERALSNEVRDLQWLIGDLEFEEDTSFMTEVSALSDQNRARIEALHAIPSDAVGKDRYRLADELRPQAHKDSPTYKDVYGKLLWDSPAQTITTGFMTPGRGRYVHPSRPRTLSPLEAARIQGFPDDYNFGPSGRPTRSSLAKWIGDAVPSPMGFAAGLSGLLPIFTK